MAANTWPNAVSYPYHGQDYNPSPVALKNGTLLLFLSRQTTSGWSILYSRYNNGGWSSETTLTTSPPGDQSPAQRAIQDSSGKIWATWTRNDNGDLRLKFADTNSNGSWDLGEPIVYDSNNNGIYDNGESTIYGTAPAQGALLRNDSHLKFIDSNGDGQWDSGEFVMYDGSLNNLYSPRLSFIDTNNNNVWDSGESIVYDADLSGTYAIHSGIGNCVGTSLASDCVIVGSLPASNNTAVKHDAQIRFVDPDNDGAWRPGDVLIYDRNSNGGYDSGEQVMTPLTSDPTLKFIGSGNTWTSGNAVVYNTNGDTIYDSRIKFVNSTNNPTETWSPGKTVVFDNSLSGVFYPSDPIIAGSNPGFLASLRNDPVLKFVDTSGDGQWNLGETVVSDSNSDGQYGSGDIIVAGTAPPSGTTLLTSLGQPWINQGVPGVTAPLPGASLKTDPKVRFVDSSGNGRWDLDEPVAYDIANTGIFSTGDTPIAGTPIPAAGTLLKSDDPILSGFTVSGNTPLSIDSKIRYVDSGSNGHWVPGDTVVYNTGPVGVYTAGKFHNDTIVNGPAPANQTALQTDPRLKYVEYQSPSDHQWEAGETVLYDTNSTGLFRVGDPIVASYPSPSQAAFLRSDSLLKYFDTSGDGIWEQGEPVVYANSTMGSSTYFTGELTVGGPVPPEGAALSSDSHIQFIDTNNNAVWNWGEPVVYHTNAGTGYVTGEPVIAPGGLPAAGNPAHVVPRIFVKNFNGVSWSADQRVTSQLTGDHSPSLTQTLDGRIWVIWVGDRTSPMETLYSTTQDGNSWSPETALYSGTTADSGPSIAQDRNGTIWATWSHLVPCSGCGGIFPYQSDIYSSFSTDNGATWSSPIDLTLNCNTSEGSCSTTQEVQPRLAQLADKKLYVFLSLWCPASSTPPCSENLFYLNNLVQAHSAKMTGATFSPTNSSGAINLRAGQTLTVKANVTNNGDYNDTMTFRLILNGTSVSTNSSIVKAGQTLQFILRWNTNIKPGHYIAMANVSDPGETLPSQGDNSITFSGKTLIRPTGDVNGDCIVNISDLAIVAANFGKSVGNPGYNPLADVNGDGTINISDLSIIGSTFGQTC